VIEEAVSPVVQTEMSPVFNPPTSVTLSPKQNPMSSPNEKVESAVNSSAPISGNWALRESPSRSLATKGKGVPAESSCCAQTLKLVGAL